MKNNTSDGVEKKELIGKGEWLALERIAYTDDAGETRRWESVSRLRCRGAVLMIATLRPSGELILVSQLRPPAAARVVEFPAGLVDEAESVEAAAVRELREEPGYSGSVARVLPPSFTSPGLSSETVAIAEIEVDMSLPENSRPAPSPEESESIQTILVPKKRLLQKLTALSAKGFAIDSKLLAYALASDKN